MREMLGMAMALVLLRLRSASANNGYCADEKCFSIHASAASFSAASHACKEKGGHLMTVRTEQTSSVLSDLLENSNVTGDFWLGLEYVDARCLDSTGGLKGYKWITGDDTTHYSNWKITDAVCFSRCVSVSKNAQTWHERSCQEIIQGYLCEYNNTEYCHPLLGTNASYETPFGFTSDNLKKIPCGSNGTAQPLGTRHMCFYGTWIQAPWSCEVFGGGCEHKCEKTPQSHRCICPAGFKIDMNRVTCSQNDDPCARAGCAQECFSSGATHVCACGPGFQLHADGKTCEDINECTDTSACPGANKECVNTLGSFKCPCAPGFENEGGACVDVDECAAGPCEHDCVNTKGGYNCSCGEGFKQSTEDVHKCKMHCPTFECPADCDPNNNAQCECPDGFLLEDERCVDIDECDSGSCDQGCENTPGSFACSCSEGFRLLENGMCVTDEFEGSGTSDPFDLFKPTSRPPAVKPASLSAGSLLGIMVCTVISILLLVCLAHCVRSKMHHYDVHKGHDEIYDFQQVIIDKNTHLSYPNRYLKRET
ncbi:thrombomodulin [Triplophysa rosa]|uniref:Thrombomodulin n=1 Tax=Triplophysa rosa TaxID=992332 RepID=A0A9W7TP14_TRIRA|nr:thrombomodulin [Triplophysa rosa]KAI7799853.1 putative thrombomodulin-like [Triplophysa rosa]